jgi:hypothetical protein
MTTRRVLFSALSAAGLALATSQAIAQVDPNKNNDSAPPGQPPVVTPAPQAGTTPAPGLPAPPVVPKKRKPGQAGADEEDNDPANVTR